MAGKFDDRWKRVSGQDVKTSGAAARYARALFELAKEANCIDSIEAELSVLRSALTENADLSGALNSPVIGAAEKAAVITAIAKKAKLSKLTTNFVGMAAKAGRAHELVQMTAAYAMMCAKARGALHAEAATAQPMSAKQEKDLASTLKTVLGQDVNIETRVDPALLGGLVIKIGSRMFDSSLKSKLEGLTMVMKES
jgi:F-type H+-transporting ATPase subunit delta